MKNKRQEFIWIDLGACIYPTEEMKMMVSLAMAKVLGAVWFAYVYFSLCDVLFDS